MFRIKFPNGLLEQLRKRLLSDLTREHFAILLGRRSTMDPMTIRVIAVRYPTGSEVISSSRTHVTPDKSYIHRILQELESRCDVDVLVDVHTHPFSSDCARFSGVDDNDEIRFSKFLTDHLPNLLYGSIVFSQSEYGARIWLGDSPTRAVNAEIVPQRSVEAVPQTGRRRPQAVEGVGDHVYAKVDPVLAVPDLRKTLQREVILIAGLGGLGSLIAENLVQMGFSNFVLVDPDRVELSNLSRLAGATRSDVFRRRYKVDVAKRRLREINPISLVEALRCGVEDQRVVEKAKRASWIVVATDNHSSRLHSQRLSNDLFVPLLAAGVNISVDDGVVSDESGEVLLCVNGTNVCLICAGRINLVKVFQESHPSATIRDLIVERGYVSGLSVSEPAVKTLNAVVAAIAVDTLVDQYTGRRIRSILQVYDNTISPKILENEDTLPEKMGCFSCSISESEDA